MSNYFFINTTQTERIDQKIIYISSEKYIALSKTPITEELSKNNKTFFADVANLWLNWIDPRLKLSSKNKYR